MHPYRRGDTGLAVAEIRAKLETLGLLPAGQGADVPADDAVFDERVDRAVRWFQQSRGLHAHGVVDRETYFALEEARWRLGDRVLSYTVNHPFVGDDVAALQQRLSDMGFDAGRIDGIFGPTTETALRDFQRNVGLTPDGTCGPLTLKMLSRLARTVTGGRPHDLRESELLHRAGPTPMGKLVILDPGHGGADRGAVGGGLEEAEIVEDLATRVEGRLTASGVSAFLTRGADAELTDAERAEFANAAEADLFVSLHVDGHDNPRCHGVATYHFGAGAQSGRPAVGSAMGARLADLVQREIVARTDLTDCRVHPKTWELLRRTRMPAVRVEVGYLTNEGDAARLSSPEFRDSVAEGIVAAVQRLYLPEEQDVPTGMFPVVAAHA